MISASVSLQESPENPLLMQIPFNSSYPLRVLFYVENSSLQKKAINAPEGEQ
jgi:hypothetical protein